MEVSKVLLIAAIVAFIFPTPGIIAKDYILIPLSFSVLFSLLGTTEKFKVNIHAIKTGVIYSYGVLSFALIILSLFLPSGIREGIILYALFPPAIGTMALTFSWGGKTGEVFVFQLLSYLFSLIFIPLAALVLIGAEVNPSLLFEYLILIFIIPAGASAILKPKNKKLMTELSVVFLGFVYYITIAKSQAWMLTNGYSMLVYAIPLAMICFLISYIVLKFKKDPDALLYSIFKNGGAAAAASIAILPEAATAIISVKVLIDVGLVIVFGKLLKK